MDNELVDSILCPVGTFCFFSSGLSSPEKRASPSELDRGRERYAGKEIMGLFCIRNASPIEEIFAHIGTKISQNLP
ncbi:hypothetical protein [Duganella sp. LjRoot269]|uniref:hypothetical protein n=1 Tax=Duganella sp. LjRoot269 TaxID=3342305 RepID=UPI003ECDBD8B